LCLLLSLKTLLGIVLPIYLFQLNHAAVSLVLSAAFACIFASRLISDNVLNRTFRIQSEFMIGTEPKLYSFKKHSQLLYLIFRVGVKVGLGIVFVTSSFSTLQHPWSSSFAPLVVIFTLLKKFTREIQQIRNFSIFPIFLNPIQYFGKRSKELFYKEIGFFHRITSIPLDIITQSYIFLNLIPSSASLFSDSNNNLLDSWRVITIFRSLSSVAHSSETSGSDCCIIIAINQIIGLQSNSSFSTWWNNLDFGSQLFLVHVFKSMYLRLIEKSYFWIISLQHFLVRTQFDSHFYQF
jgi:hypothetical protein